jgi:ATP-dependent Clp protease ATP-binding subunit ClpC
VHVRESPGGTAVVTPIPLAELSCAGDSVAAAERGVKVLLKARLEALEPVDFLPYAAPPEATLLRVPVDVQIGGRSGERVEIAVAVAVVERTVRDRSVLVAYAPVLPKFEVVSRDGDLERLAARLVPRLAARLRSWSAAEVLNADEPHDSRLDVLELELGAGAGEQLPSAAPDEDDILEALGVDLTRRPGGHLDGREELVERVLETLAAPGRSSVLLVGPKDVGKSALVHELARRIAAGAAPDRLAGVAVWRVSANELIAGATYTGMWQDRVRNLIAQARRTRAVVVMGDPVGIIDAGRWSRSDNNFSRYLRPYVESGEITIVCEATPDQLAAALKQEPSFVGAFHRIDVPEPTVDECREILAAAASRLAAEESVVIEPQAIDAAVELTGRFEPYNSFPGKAIRLLEDTARERSDEGLPLDRAALTASFARRTGMPLALLSDVVPLRIAEVRQHFEERVLGQPEATGAMVDVISVLKAGLTDPQKPLGSFFFVGPTGVGKTESAKALAEFLFGSRDRLIRFDMGEYTSGDAVQRLVGTAWGSEEGELVKRVREQPFSVVLLDEIEKANAKVFDALLAAVGEGRLTDAAGRVADFRNAIVIMTSNLGATRTRSSPLGFGGDAAGASAHQRYVEEAERFFRPEFFNRIDRVVVFHALSQQTVRRIARRELDRLLVREGIVRRRLLVEIDESVVEQVAGSGFHSRYGARPLQRSIERLVIEPLARLLVERQPQGGGFVRVHLLDGRIAVDFERIKEPKPSAARQRRRAVEDDATFARSERHVAEFAAQLASDEASNAALDVRAVVSELIDSTHERAFWDDSSRARATLQRIYQLEHLLDRFDAIHRRCEGLKELARRVREAHDRTRLGEIRRACDEMNDELTVLRLELAAAAAGGDSGGAVVRAIPVGHATAWAERLLEMYAAWAERTARQAIRSSADELSLTISGPATFDLLAGEAGLHRHVQPERHDELARIAIGEPGSVTERREDDPGAVVRVYEEGKRRVVRDPRTGIRESHLIRVLDQGHIDAFLIAALRAAAVPPEDDRAHRLSEHAELQ